MSDALMAVSFGLIAAVGWGIGDFWGARASKTIGAVTALAATNFVLLAFYLLIYAFLPASGMALSTSGIILSLASGIILTGAAMLLYKGFVYGPVSLVAPISAAYPLYVALFAIVLFQAHLSLRQVIAVSMVVLGVMAAAGIFKLKKSERHLSRGPVLAMIASLFYGIGITVLVQAVERIGWQQAALFEFIGFGLASLPLLVFLERGKGDSGQSRGQVLKQALKNRFVIGNALVATMAILAFNIGLTNGAAMGTIMVATSAAYPVLTMALALRHFEERVGLSSLLGALASVTGIVILALG